MKENKIIHAHIFKPHRSLFKQAKNGRAEVQVVSCCNSENCGLFARGECSLVVGISSIPCEYGRRTVHTGWTRRANKYYDWISQQEKKYKGVGCLKPHSRRMAIVGDYVFLPYSHMNMCEDVQGLSGGGFFASGGFLKTADFTESVVHILIAFRPHAIFGGEITSYQKEVPPEFLKHLSEQMPDLFNAVISNSDYARKRFEEFTNIGRKALLETLTPNVGKFKDIHGGLWTWDGTAIISKNSKAAFMLVKKFQSITLVPSEKQEVTITDENQVNSGTVFI